MLDFLSNHPFAVDAQFDYSLVLTYAVPKASLEPLIPACLELDTFGDEWAFVAVAMVQTKGLRPAFFPPFLGTDFFLTGYRIFVRYTTNAGKRLRGLYILRSETDSKRMEYLGSVFTKYRYVTVDVQQRETGTVRGIQSQQSGLDILVDTEPETPALPPGSPFADWKEARRFAGPLPFTFSFDPATRRVLIVEGVREFWQPKPVQVLRADIGFLDTLHLPEKTLANAFIINSIPYHWKPGRTEQWNQHENRSKA